MGCDIHMVVERRIGRTELGDKWVGIDAMRRVTVRKLAKADLGFAIPTVRDRNYVRFARLAGVRGNGPPPRGLPEDISDLARLEVDGWGADGHSHSWLPIDEAARLFLETEWRKGDPDPQSYEAKFPVAHYFGVETESVADYRLIFWFDN